MVRKIKKKDIVGLESLIRVGLEYGDNNKDGKMDDKKIQTEFPKLYKILTGK